MAFEAVKGQGHAIEYFEKVLGNGRLAHAYLFQGPEGVGKKSFAIELAKGLFCSKASKDGVSACNSCPSCRKVGRGEHENLFLIHVLEGKQQIAIDQMREVARSLSLKAVDRIHRVCIIDDAEKMSDEAANALLKTIEEPPPWSLLILVSSKPEFLFETIRSRCQVVKFRPLEEKVVFELLGSLEGLSADERSALSRLSQGSVGVALRHAKEGFLRRRFEFVEAILGGGVVEAGEIVEGYKKRSETSEGARAHVRELLDQLLSFLRDCLVVAGGMGLEDVRNVDMRTLIERESRRPLWWSHEAIEHVQEAREHIDRNANPKIVVESLGMKLR